MNGKVTMMNRWRKSKWSKNTPLVNQITMKNRAREYRCALIEVNCGIQHLLSLKQMPYIDQLINYASMRKSQGAVRRVNLGAVGKTEIGDSKLDYTDIGNFIRFSRTDDEHVVTLDCPRDCVLDEE